MNCKIDNEKIFYVEIDKENNKKLFFQIDYFNSIKKNAYLNVFDQKINFFEYFSLLRERTGSHVPKGELFSRNIYIPKKIDNYKLNKYIKAFFNNDLFN